MCVMHKLFGTKENVNYIDREGVYLVPVKDGKVGVVKTPKGYFLIGGGLDSGESHEECIKRECLEEGHVRAWSKDKYHLLANESKNSYLTDCGLAVLDSIEQCESKEQFINNMKKRGWKVIWKDSRKNITFENEEGKRVRDKNLSKTFNLNITKEGVLNEFERQNKIRIRRESDDELERYCREVEAIIGGDYGVAKEREGEQCEIEKGKAEVAGTGSEVGGKEEGASRRNNRARRR